MLRAFRCSIGASQSQPSEAEKEAKVVNEKENARIVESFTNTDFSKAEDNAEIVALARKIVSP